MGSTAAANPAHASSSEFYDPDEVVPRGSPIMAARQVVLRPSVTPPPILSLPPAITSFSDAGSQKSYRRSTIVPNGGDRMLLESLDGGRNPDISAIGAVEALPSDEEENIASDDLESLEDGSCGSKDGDCAAPDVEQPPRTREDNSTKNHDMPATSPEPGGIGIFDLKSLAAGALAVTGIAPTTTDITNAGPTPPVTESDVVMQEKRQPGTVPPPPTGQNGVPHAEERSPVVGAPATSYMSPYSEASLSSPRDSSHILLAKLDIRSPTMMPSEQGELPPIQLNSPRSDTTAQTPLPSINEQLGDLRQLHENARDKDGNILHPAYQHSPPATFPRMALAPRHQGSPPISPDEAFHRGLPSPRYMGGQQPLAPAPPSHSSTYNSYFQHHAPPRGTEFPTRRNTGQSADARSESTSSGADPMSIDGLTATGVYICPWANCTAAPFQTQYLLNSHANVHSSARPHFCPVKGCNRSEGGKGFKRKNEMIRHGLVHESPGYVCPFCPDREHKYPRPDNLQR
jgi:hypothetical protein